MDQIQTPSHPVSKLLETIGWIVLSAYIITAPLAFSSITLGSSFDFPKWLLTVVTAILMLFLWGLKTIITKHLVLPSRTFTIPLTLLFAATIVSMLLSRTNLVSFLMGKAGFFIAFIIIVLLGSVVAGKKVKQFTPALIISTLLLSVIQILTFFDVLQKIIKDPVVTGKTFTPLGSQLTLVTFLVVMLPALIYMAFKSQAFQKKVGLFVISGITTVALVLGIAQILPGQPNSPSLMPFSAGWSLAVDQLKTGKTALFGVGPDRFAITFSKFRPAILNQGDLWYARYSTSTNEWLTILTTMGIVGLVILVVTILGFTKTVLQNRRNDGVASVGISWSVLLVLLTFLPSNFATMFMLFILMLILLGFDSQSDVVVKHKAVIAAGIPALLLALAMCYFSGRAAIAEVAFGQSLQKGTENKFVEMYNKQIEAIRYNPYVARYRLSYSNTNFAIANGLAAKQDLTDDDRTKITQLISQSIREAKASVALDQENANSWVNLAGIYRQLINFAQGADQWVIASYIQAIRLDNTNPQLRVDLGGLLFSLRRYEEAIDQFKQAIVLKPDYANAYYNLSNAYKNTNQPIQAYAAMQNVVKLIDPNSADYEKALTELNDLQKALPQQAQSATAAAAARETALTKPSPLPSPAAQPVQFDQNQQQELAPEVENVPTPVATPVPVPAATESANQ